MDSAEKHESTFIYEVPKTSIKKALKSELYSSFGVERQNSTDAMMEYLLDNFFWELFYHFEQELIVLFSQGENISFGGEFL